MRNYCKHRELHSVLCGDLNGKKPQKEGYICTYSLTHFAIQQYLIINLTQFLFHNWGPSFTLPVNWDLPLIGYFECIAKAIFSPPKVYKNGYI